MYYMRQTIISFILMFLTVGTVSAQQAIAEVAEELARSFPEECEMHGKNINGYWLRTTLPIGLIRPSLLDSLKETFNEEVANADYVAVMKNHNYHDESDTLSYTLGWGKVDGYRFQYNKQFEQDPSERGRDMTPFTPYFATLDIVNDMVFFQYVNNYQDGDTSPEPFDSSVFEALLDQVKAMPNVRKKKVKIPADQDRNMLSGYEYVVNHQYADSLFRRFGESLLRNYYNGNRPIYYHYNPQKIFTDVNYGNELHIQTSDARIVEMRVRQDNLLILDVEDQHKDIRQAWQSIIDDWARMLEPELDSLQWQPRYSNLQVGDRYYALKNAAHSMIEWFGPEWEKPLLSYEVSELKTYKADVRPAAQPYLGRQYYTVTVRYLHQKERGIQEDFAAIVDVWNDTKQPIPGPYDPTTPKMVTFPNGNTVDFIEKSFQKRSKERIDEWRKEERGKRKE